MWIEDATAFVPWRCHEAGSVKMPRACPVELHDRRYSRSKPRIPDATGLPRGVLPFEAT